MICALSADHPPVAEGEVHVWHVEAPPIASQTDWSLLCPEERLRADRFRFDRDRDHFVIFRAALRRILSIYLCRSPESHRLLYGPHGKPYLESERGQEDIRFNLSHSRDQALIAVTRGRDIGVDLEHLQSGVECVRHFLTGDENAFIQRHDVDDQPKAFLACWTRKEAWMKALGCGVSASLHRFDVAASLGRSTAKLMTKEAEPTDWSVCEMHPGSDTVAAIVVRGRLQNLNLRRWAPADA